MNQVLVCMVCIMLREIRPYTQVGMILLVDELELGLHRTIGYEWCVSLLSDKEYKQYYSCACRF